METQVLDTLEDQVLSLERIEVGLIRDLIKRLQGCERALDELEHRVQLLAMDNEDVLGRAR